MTAADARYRPKKRFGQHFLVDGRIADRIVEAADVGPGDAVLEIGPGKGILTERLLGRAGTVYAVEIDRELVSFLREKFPPESGLILVESDILSFDLSRIPVDPPGRVKIVSNIPYNISGLIVDYLIGWRERISRAVLMLQREVARRLLAEPGTRDYGLMTLNLALCAGGRKVMDVRPGSFFPPPEVHSSVVSLVFEGGYRYPLDDEGVFRVLTGVAFRQRRKMVRNTLVPYLVSRGLTAPQALELLRAAGIKPESRPETIGVEMFVELSNAFRGLCPGGDVPGCPK